MNKNKKCNGGSHYKFIRSEHCLRLTMNPTQDQCKDCHKVM